MNSIGSLWLIGWLFSIGYLGLRCILKLMFSGVNSDKLQGARKGIDVEDIVPDEQR